MFKLVLDLTRITIASLRQKLRQKIDKKLNQFSGLTGFSIAVVPDVWIRLRWAR